MYAMQMETSRQLKETRAKYDIIINEFIHENVMVIKPDYSILDVNETLLGNLGIPREDAIGRYCYEVTHFQNTPCAGEGTICPLAEAFRTRKPSKTTHIHPSDENKDR